jgi:Zn-finger nucleic acid-binding protein
MIEKTLIDELHVTGYDREEEYFFRKNLQLIEQNRRRLDAQRLLRERSEGGKAFWMRCPNCGHDLKATEAPFGLKGDVCASCGGVFLMHDELQHLTEAYEPATFKAAIKRILDDLTKPLPSGIGQFPV